MKHDGGFDFRHGIFKILFTPRRRESGVVIVVGHTSGGVVVGMSLMSRMRGWHGGVVRGLLERQLVERARRRRQYQVGRQRRGCIVGRRHLGCDPHPAKRWSGGSTGIEYRGKVVVATWRGLVRLPIGHNKEGCQYKQQDHLTEYTRDTHWLLEHRHFLQEHFTEQYSQLNQQPYHNEDYSF